MNRYRLISAKYPGACSGCGKQFKERQVVWWDMTEKGICYHFKCHPDGLDKKGIELAYRKADTRTLKHACFELGISARHGTRRKVYKMSKWELLQLLLDDHRENGDEEAKTETEKVSKPEVSFAKIEGVIKELIDKGLEEADFSDIISKELKKRQPTVVEVKQPKKKKIKMGVQHVKFPMLLDYLAAGLSVYLVGAAGSGKSWAGAACAKALSKKFYAESVSQQTPVSILKGYMNADGDYVTTNFREALENGDVFMLDEIDAGNPNVIAALNAAVATEPGGLVAFPDGMIKKHAGFVCIAAANTYGRGADREYVGRNPLDAASLDRFVIIEWSYDENLELSLCEQHGWDLKWVAYVQRSRKAVEELKVRLVISPRASFFGCRLLAQGRAWDEVEEAVIFKGLDRNTVEKIKERANV